MSGSEALVAAAAAFARERHAPQRRLSGEPYFAHAEAVAAAVTAWGMDAPTVAAAYLHDLLEETAVSAAEVERRFGAETAALVAAVTTLRRLDFASEAEYERANLGRMFLALAGDLRAVMIKLADRWDNLRTLAALPPDRRRKFARETLYLFAPLAERLGLGRLTGELEDLAFRHLEPERYRDLAQAVAARRAAREARVTALRTELADLLIREGVRADVAGRAKNLYRVYRKMAADGRPFDEVYDLMGLRVIAPDAAACYRALDVVHAYYTPVAGRYKDYIARPKANFYQSIHTTVRRPDGALVEVQIRTPEMDAVAEYGVAAHWRYKAGAAERKWGEHPALDLLRAGLRGLGPAPARAPLEALFADLVHEDVFIFTPRGEVKRLPRGATPVDFSYAVHTAVGHRCTGAKVNGKLAPLRTVLETGDVVEVLTGATAAPRRDWLEFVVSAGARHKIRAFLRRRDRAGLAARGRTLLRREAAKLGLNARRAVSGEAVAELARGHNLPSGEELLVRVGEGALAAAAVAAAWAPTPAKAPAPSPLGPPDYSASVRVAGVSRLEVRLARCCAPAPAVPVVGYVTSRGAVTVHRATCAVVGRFGGAARLVEAAWRLEEEAARGAVIRFDLPDGGAPLAAAVRGVRRAGLRLAGVAVEKTGAGVRCTLQVSMATRPRLELAASRLRAMPAVARLELAAFG